MKFLSVFLIFTASCVGHHRPQVATPSAALDSLKTKYDLWLKELTDAQDKDTGWLNFLDCDATLWTGEAVTAGLAAKLSVAEWAPGAIHRRPQLSGECYPDAAASTVSSDMLTGYVAGLWATKDLEALTRLQAYGETHRWQMGRPGGAATYYSPSGQGLLARAIEKLGGAKTAYSLLPLACLPVLSDFEFHLQTLAALTEGDIAGELSSQCYAALKANAQKYPNDALLQAAWGIYGGDFAPATELLTAQTYLCPTYVRPVPIYCTVHKLMAAATVLNHRGGGL